MPTECNPGLFDFGSIEGRRVVAAFDGGRVTSDAGALLLGATDKAIGLIERLAACFHDERRAELVEHQVPALIGQRVFAIALGYEDLVDHDELRFDPVLAALSEKLEAKRADCAPLAGSRHSTAWSTRRTARRHATTGSATTAPRSTGCSSSCSSRRMRRRRARSSSIWMLPTIRCTVLRRAVSSTDITIVTAICRYTSSAADICSPPNCGDRTSTHRPARPRRSSGSSARSGSTGRGCGSSCGPISGFAQERLMAWYEDNRVDYVFGLARNERLEKRLAAALDEARRISRATGHPARVFRDFL